MGAFENDRVALMLNDGTGSFSAAQTYAVGQEPLGVICGRFNSDHLWDLATVDSLDDTVSVLFNNAQTPGTFSDVQPQDKYPVGRRPVVLVACDLDGDCLDDIAAFDDLDGTISVLLNNYQDAGRFRPRISLPAGCTPNAAACCDLDLNGRHDLVDGIRKIDHDRPYIRFTYNLGPCEGEPAGVIKGDLFNDCGVTPAPGDCNTNSTCDCAAQCMQTGCCINGCDIQPFVNTYLDPLNASRNCYCLADMNGDGLINEVDRQCFINRLLGLPPFVACNLGQCGTLLTGSGGGGSSAPAGGDGGSGASAPASPPPSAPPNPRLAAAYAALCAWRAEHPPSAHPELSRRQYVHMHMSYQAQLGLVACDYVAAVDCYYAWEERNPRSAYPGLTYTQYSHMAIDKLVECGVFRARP